MSKKFLLAFGLILVVFFALDNFKTSTAQENSEGKIGDVKYSILDPDKFREQNGKGWVLMDGNSIKDSDLSVLIGMDTAPDARGVFIRGMNVKREPSNGDASGDRLVGGYQRDEFRSHQHDIAPRINVGHSVNGNGSSRRFDTDDGHTWGNIDEDMYAMDNTGGAETRPRNITLYTYIKINN